MIPFTFYLDQLRDLSNSSRVEVVPRLVLANQTSVSIQASEGHYCSPRKTLNSYSAYSMFEVGFPEWVVPPNYEMFFPKNSDDVFGFIPADVIQRVIDYNGGVVGWRVNDKSIQEFTFEPSAPTLWALKVDTSVKK